MAEQMEKTIIVPDNQNNGWGNGLPLALALNPGWGNNNYPYPPYAYGMGNNNGFFGGSGFGAGILGGLLGGLIWGGIGNGNWNFGNWGNGGGAAASLGAQATAIGNTDTILRAIDGTDSDVRLLATTLNTDVDSVKTNLFTLQNGLTALTGQTGLSAQQIINAIQAGDASLAASLCDCCCRMQQQVLTQGYESRIQNMQQTETLGNAINGNGQRTVDAIADLKTTMVKEFCDVKEREMQSKIDTQADIITQLRNAADNAAQTNQLMSYVGSVVAPIAKEVNDIKCRLPETVNVPYPQLSVVNTTPNFGNNYGPNYGYGNGFWGGFGGFGNGFGGFGGNVVF